MGASLALIRDYPWYVGRVHLEQIDPSSTCTVVTKVNADDLLSGPAVTLSAMCETAQAFCLSLPKASIARGAPAHLKAFRPAAGR